MRRITLLTNPNLCNLHCPLCFLNQRKRPLHWGEMPFDVACAAIEKYAKDSDGRGARLLKEVVPSTMGEPLLYSKFGELLDFCVIRGIKLNLTTNGTFPGTWGSEACLEKLLSACSDIKISTLSYEMGGVSYSQWRENVERLMACRRRLEKTGRPLSTVSLQVTLHGKNVNAESSAIGWAKGVLQFAENLGIHRIKWNPVVLLKDASAELREQFAVEESLLENLRHELRQGSLCLSKVKNEGSLFFEKSLKLCPVGGTCEACPFADEVWVWPDGHEDHCPNPERRFGNG